MAQLPAAADVFAARRSAHGARHTSKLRRSTSCCRRQEPGGSRNRRRGAVLEARGHHAALADRASPDLTPRESEILGHLAQGLLTKQIATRIDIACETADNHIQNIHKKIGATSRTAAAMHAVEHPAVRRVTRRAPAVCEASTPVDFPGRVPAGRAPTSQGI